jgi:hypothetical protein
MTSFSFRSLPSDLTQWSPLYQTRCQKNHLIFRNISTPCWKVIYPLQSDEYILFPWGYRCLTLNIFYCSIINNWIGHKFHNLEMSSPKSIMCARDMDFVSGSTTFWLDYWTVRTVWYLALHSHFNKKSRV